MIVNRYDTIDINKMATKFVKTDEGYLKGRAVVARTGVYKYMKADGTYDYEYRSYEEVFNNDAIETLKLKPLSILHPDQMVNSENIKLYQVGNMGSEWAAVKRDNEFDLVIDIIIQDSDAVTKIESGEMRELSLGYHCDMEDAPKGSKFDGMDYNKIQKNIRINHCAIVPNGRAGTAIIKMDATDAILVDEVVPVATHDKKDSKEEKPMADLKKIKLDGVEYEAEAPVIATLTQTEEKVDSLQKSLDTLTSDKEKVEAERDTLKAKVDSLEKEIVEANTSKLDADAIKAAVARRIKVLDAAREAEIEVKEDMDEKAVLTAVISKVFPTVNLDGKSDEYVQASFDLALAEMEKKADAVTRSANTETVHTDAGESELEKARKAYAERLVKKV